MTSGDSPTAAPSGSTLRRLRGVCACIVVCGVWLASTGLRAQDVLPTGPTLAWALSGAAGFMRGGRGGGLMTAQMTPMALEFQGLSIQEDDQWLIGGALRFELEQAMAVAGIAKVAFRHSLGKLELRPGASLPFYFAPKTMLGPQADLGIRYKLSDSMGLLGQLTAAAFMIGNDVPHGSTVLMFHLFFGVELLL
jgi:hypothetical protein